MIGSIILIFIILIVIVTNNPRLFEKIIEHSSEKTQFNTTYFEVYDKSTVDNCDRLIIVQPFKWHIWGIDGHIYLLNESNKSCPLNYTPTVVVPNKGEDYTTQVFKDVCINRVFNDVITNYTDSILPVIIDFDIKDIQQEENKFTILDALNFLLTKYLTMDPPTSDDDTIHKSNEKLKMNKIKTGGISNVHNMKVFTKNSIDNYKIKQILQRTKFSE